MCVCINHLVFLSIYQTHLQDRMSTLILGTNNTIRVSSRIFCLGGKIVCKDQLCVKHAKFLSPFLSINHQCTKKHKARVFIIRYSINSQNFWGGSWRVWGGSFPPHPPVDETLTIMHIRGPTIQTYEGPQGPGTMLLKSGTVPEFQGPLRPMQWSMFHDLFSHAHLHTYVPP